MSKIAIASWKRWSPTAYLREFYVGEVVPDEIETIAFLVKLAKKIPVGQKILEFGCGPTLHHIFPFVPYVSEIHMVDFLKSNLNEVNKWVSSIEGAHNWDKYIAYTLRCEGIKRITSRDILKRRRETIKKITSIEQADARRNNPLGKNIHELYPIVISCYCADSATNNHKDFKIFIRNIVSLLKPGGIFIIACLRKASYYRSGNLYFPSANVDENLLRRILEYDFSPKTIKIFTKRLTAHKEQGYTSIILR